MGMGQVVVNVDRTLHAFFPSEIVLLAHAIYGQLHGSIEYFHGGGFHFGFCRKVIDIVLLAEISERRIEKLFAVVSLNFHGIAGGSRQYLPKTGKYFSGRFIADDFCIALPRKNVHFCQKKLVSLAIGMQIHQIQLPLIVETVRSGGESLENLLSIPYDLVCSDKLFFKSFHVGQSYFTHTRRREIFVYASGRLHVHGRSLVQKSFVQDLVLCVPRFFRHVFETKSRGRVSDKKIFLLFYSSILH